MSAKIINFGWHLTNLLHTVKGPFCKTQCKHEQVDHSFHKVRYQHSNQVWLVNMHIFVVNFLGYAATEYYWNWIICSQFFTKVKRVTFFWNTGYTASALVCARGINCASCITLSLFCLCTVSFNIHCIEFESRCGADAWSPGPLGKKTWGAWCPTLAGLSERPDKCCESVVGERTSMRWRLSEKHWY